MTDRSAGHLKSGGDQPLKGILLMILAVTVVPAMDGLAKYMAELGYAVILIVWARFFFSAVIMVPLVLVRFGTKAVNPPDKGMIMARGTALLIATFLFFTAISRIPLADAIGIYFVYPMVTMALSVFLLGEVVGVRRWMAALAGLAGAMMIVRPGLGQVDPGVFYVLGASLAMGFYMVATRKLSGRVPPSIVLTWQTIPGTVLLTAALPWIWQPVEPLVWAGFFLLGGVSAVAHMFLVLAFDHAPASLLAPFGYFEIVGATAIGYLVFGDFPDGMTWAGITVIIASGLYISWREQVKLGRVTRREPSP